MDIAAHTISTYDGRMTDDAKFSPGQKYAYTFIKAGIYKYHCKIHPDEKGMVIVTD
jgi:plastocyanin